MQALPTLDQRRGLQKIARCDDNRRALDIIFIHGLGGDSWTTWMADEDMVGSFWPHWLAEDRNDAGLWTLGYSTSASKWKSESIPLGDRGNQILDLLTNEGIGSRPTVFVTHSMGGIVVKQLLRNALSFNISRFQAIASNTCGIMFIATPHSGANIASFAELVSVLYRTNEDVKEMSAHSSRLRELHGWFINKYLEDYKVVCRTYGESLEIKPEIPFLKVKLPKGILVVDPTSSEPNIKNERAIFLEKDHFSICKPTKKSSQLYKGVIQFLRDCLPFDVTPGSFVGESVNAPLDLSSLEALLAHHFLKTRINNNDLIELFQNIQDAHISLKQLSSYIETSLPVLNELNLKTDLFDQHNFSFEKLTSNGVCRLILDIRDDRFWNRGKGKLTPILLRTSIKTYFTN